MSIKVICDSTSYIPQNLLEEYDIDIVSLSVIVENKSYRETDVDNGIFYEKLKQCKTLPTSSQPSVDEIFTCFLKYVEENRQVVGVFMSSDMSGTVSAANLAKKMVIEKFPSAVIEIVDSRTNCMQEGYVALAAAKEANKGSSMGQVLEAADKVIKNSRFLFVPDTLEYLKKGGRIGGAAALLGSFLQIRPILTVVDGKTSIYDKVRTKKKAVERMIEAFKKDINEKGLGEVIVHHINSESEGLELAAKLENMLGIPVSACSIGVVIGLHVGPGAVGIVYYTKEQ